VAKTLQADSIYNQFDEDGDGIVTDEEMAKAERMLQIGKSGANAPDRKR
jgi:hypothetical protein